MYVSAKKLFFKSLQVCVHRKSSKQDSLESCCSQTLNGFLLDRFLGFLSKTIEFQIQHYIFSASGWWWFPKTICCRTYQSSSPNVVKRYSLISKPLIACYRSYLKLRSTLVTAIYTAIEDEQAGELYRLQLIFIKLFLAVWLSEYLLHPPISVHMHITVQTLFLWNFAISISHLSPNLLSLGLILSARK